MTDIGCRRRLGRWSPSCKDCRRRSSAVAADRPHRASTAVQYGGTVGSDGSAVCLGNGHDAPAQRYLNSTWSALTSMLTGF